MAYGFKRVILQWIRNRHLSVYRNAKHDHLGSGIASFSPRDPVDWSASSNLFVSGTYHDFRVTFTNSTAHDFHDRWRNSNSNNTYLANQKLTNASLPADITSFATTSDPTQTIYLDLEIYGGTSENVIDAPVALDILNSGNWYISIQLQQLQHSQLQV